MYIVQNVRKPSVDLPPAPGLYRGCVETCSRVLITQMHVNQSIMCGWCGVELGWWRVSSAEGSVCCSNAGSLPRLHCIAWSECTTSPLLHSLFWQLVSTLTSSSLFQTTHLPLYLYRSSCLHLKDISTLSYQCLWSKYPHQLYRLKVLCYCEM